MKKYMKENYKDILLLLWQKILNITLITINIGRIEKKLLICRKTVVIYVCKI